MKKSKGKARQSGEFRVAGGAHGESGRGRQQSPLEVWWPNRGGCVEDGNFVARTVYKLAAQQKGSGDKGNAGR